MKTKIWDHTAEPQKKGKPVSMKTGTYKKISDESTVWILNRLTALEEEVKDISTLMQSILDFLETGKPLTIDKLEMKKGK